MKQGNLLVKMYSMQDHLNRIFSGQDWKIRVPQHEMRFAVIGELFESMKWWENYEWWKPQPKKNKEQAQLELIDALHFALGFDMMRFAGGYAEHLQRHYDARINYLNSSMARYTEAISHVCGLSYDNICEMRVAPAVLSLLEKYFNLSVEEVFLIYASKYSLNTFRVENGYREGSYHKIWDPMAEDGKPKEDNYFLELHMDQMRTTYLNHPDGILDGVQAFLVKAYEGVKIDLGVREIGTSY